MIWQEAVQQSKVKIAIREDDKKLYERFEDGHCRVTYKDSGIRRNAEDYEKRGYDDWQPAASLVTYWKEPKSIGFKFL